MEQVKMNENNSNVSMLFSTVVKGGYCIGCGACAAIPNSSIEIKFDEFRKLQAIRKSVKNTGIQNGGSILSVCPFSGESKNEDEIGKVLFGKNNRWNEKLGFIDSTYAGYVNEQDYREKGSSGGMGTWILAELFKQRLIDHVAHVHQVAPSAEDQRLFKYKLSSTLEEIKQGAKSRYYPVELSEVIKQIRAKEGKYAIVGLPCFIKAVRLLMAQDKILSERIKYCIGLVCGHLKSAHFASMWSWQVGIHPTALESINFRSKLEGYGANRYGITAQGKEGGEELIRKSPPLNEMFGANWGWGLFKYNACDYCDDVVAETADVTIGDAWLPRYVKDTKGTNIVIVRNPEISKILKREKESNRLSLDDLSDEEIIESQSSGFFHRREGLAYRMFLKKKQKQWYPPKRLGASDVGISKKNKKRQELRLEIADVSHKAFQMALKENSFAIFKKQLDPLTQQYQSLYKTPYYLRIMKKIRNIFRK